MQLLSLLRDIGPDSEAAAHLVIGLWRFLCVRNL